LGKRLKSEGHYIVACDWKRNEYFSVRSGCVSGWKRSTDRYLDLHGANLSAYLFKLDSLVLFASLQEDQFCHEFHLVDLRVFDNCRKVVASG
jgi:GDP-D-mannose 3',5'-epimerase